MSQNQTQSGESNSVTVRTSEAGLVGLRDDPLVDVESVYTERGDDEDEFEVVFSTHEPEDHANPYQIQGPILGAPFTFRAPSPEGVVRLFDEFTAHLEQQHGDPEGP